MIYFTIALEEGWLREHTTPQGGPLDLLALETSMRHKGSEVRVQARSATSLILLVDEKAVDPQDLASEMVTALCDNLGLKEEDFGKVITELTGRPLSDEEAAELMNAAQVLELKEKSAQLAAEDEAVKDESGQAAEAAAGGQTENAGQTAEATAQPETPEAAAQGEAGEPVQESDGEEEQGVPDEYFYASPVDKKAVKGTLEAISTLRGARQFIAMCNEIDRIAPVLRSRNMASVVSSRNYLFSVDIGYGLRSSTRLLTLLLYNERLFNAADLPINAKLPAPESGPDPSVDVLEPVEQALQQVSKRIVVLDITEWIDRIESDRFRNFLYNLTETSDGLIYVFRVPYMQQNQMLKIVDMLNDAMLVQPVSFAPLTGRQLQEEARDLLASVNFYPDDEVWDLLQQRIAEEKSDGRFYGMDTLFKIVDDMVYRKLMSITEQPQAPEKEEAGAKKKKRKPRMPRKNEKIHIHISDLPGFVRNPVFYETPSSSLNNLVSAARIKDGICRLMDEIEEDRKDPDKAAHPVCIRFVGAPGTGKTTVARIIGGMLRERGILDKGYFFEHAAKDLIPESKVMTPAHVLSLCIDAEGSVFYIDGIYSLLEKGGEGFRKAQSAIRSLRARLNERGGNIAVIIAGDDDEMAQLIEKDPELGDDRHYVLKFPDYTREELSSIFMDMVSRSSLSAGEGLDEAVKKYFEGLDSKIIDSSEFSNARLARNLFETTFSNAVMRSQMEGEEEPAIEVEDFAAASSRDVDEYLAKRNRRARLGYHIGLV